MPVNDLITQEHIELIHQAKDLSAESLEARILNLPRLEFDAKVPMDEKQRTMFHVILEDKHLEDFLKCKLIEHLFHFIGYSSFYSMLVEGPLAEKFLKTREFNVLLTHIYTEHLIQHVNDALEHRIWQSVLTNHKNGPLLLKELQNHLAHHARILQFIEYWMDSIQDERKIVDLYDLICTIVDNRIKPYLPLIKKMANCRILTIKYHDETAHPHPGREEYVGDTIKNFLQMNEPYLFKSLMIHPSAEVVYETIQKDQVSHGKQQYIDKVTRIEHEVIEQLAEDHYEGEFKMTM